MIVVGNTYRFAGEGPYREFGNWLVTKIVKGVAYGIPTGMWGRGDELSMIHVDPKQWGDKNYHPVLVKDADPDETEAYFV